MVLLEHLPQKDGPVIVLIVQVFEHRIDRPAIFLFPALKSENRWPPLGPFVENFVDAAADNFLLLYQDVRTTSG